MTARALALPMMKKNPEKESITQSPQSRKEDQESVKIAKDKKYANPPE